mgnify:CR=1 FL=1
MKNTYIIPIIFVFLNSACTTNTISIDNHKPISFDHGFTSHEIALLGSEQKDTDWGLALSGGGIRSAMFQIGVLKSLYDNKLLEEIDVISAVSGGGYAAHWAFTSQFYAQSEKAMPDSDSSKIIPKFGTYSLDDDVFAESTCNIYKTANFVTYPRLLGNWIFKGISPPDYYERQIKRSFSSPDMGPNTVLDLSELAGLAESGSPYLIMNATIADVDDKENLQKRLYEMTYLHQGNDYLGYHIWRPSQSINFSRAAAISGAAIKLFLKQEIDTPSNTLYGDKILLSDGGHSENLGAIALIKRGMKNIIISDAEMDPTFKYEALTKLFEELSNRGYLIFEQKADGRVSISGNQNIVFSANDAYEAARGYRVFNIVKGKTHSNIYYIKMRLPTEIMPKSKRELVSRRAKGWKVTEYMRKNLLENQYDCNSAKEYFEAYTPKVSYPEWLDGVMIGYEEFLNEGASLKDQLNIAAFETAMKHNDWSSYKFPHITTIDQSFYIDQALAYIGLGFKQGELIAKRIHQ